MPSPFRYDLFISYSHADRAFAARLERALARYRPPFGAGLTPARLAVFRDESEAAGVHLSQGLQDALAASRKLIVVCSPAARRSTWVGEEIAAFAAMHGADDIIPVIVSGLPNDEAERTQRPEESAFPPALMAALPGTPWCPDFRGDADRARPVVKTWPAWFHLLAAIYGVPRETIEQKERRRNIVRTAAAALIFAAVGAAGWAFQGQRNESASLKLASAAEALPREEDLRRALELALAAVDAAPTPQAMQALDRVVRNAIGSRRWNRSVIAVSASGAAIAIGGPLGDATLHDIKANRRSNLCGFLFPVTSFHFSPGGDYVAAFSASDRQLNIYNVATGARTGAVRIEAAVTFIDIVYSPSSRTFLITGPGITPELRSLPDAALVRKLDEGSGHTVAMFNRRAGTFLTYGLNVTPGTAIWQDGTGTPLWVYDGDGPTDYAAFSRAGNRLYLRINEGGPMHRPHFYDAPLDGAGRPGELRALTAGEWDRAAVDRAGPSGDGALDPASFATRLAEAHPDLLDDYGVDYRDFDGSSLRQLDPGHLLTSPTGNAVFVSLRKGRSGGASLLVSPSDLRIRYRTEGVPGIPGALFSPDGATLALWLERPDGPNRLSMIAVADGREQWSRTDLSASERAFSPDGSRYLLRTAGPGQGATIRAFDTQTGRELARIADATPQISALHIDAAGRQIVLRDGSNAYVWSVDSGKRTASLAPRQWDNAGKAADFRALDDPEQPDAAVRIAQRYLNRCPGDGPAR